MSSEGTNKNQKVLTQSKTKVGEVNSRADGKAGANITKVQVAAYPIRIDLIAREGLPPLKALIVKLTDFGFLIRSDALHIYVVGEYYNCSFVLPASGHEIKAQCRVIKTYDGIDQVIAGKNIKIYTSELHFKDLDSKHKTAISTYLSQSGQK